MNTGIKPKDDDYDSRKLKTLVYDTLGEEDNLREKVNFCRECGLVQPLLACLF